MLRYLIIGGLFYALTPGILLSLPKKASKKTVALTHAVFYTGAYYVIEHVLGMKEGFQSGSGIMEVPAGADPATIYKIQTNNSSIIAAQMATEAAANGTTTPLYISLTTIKDQYDAAARTAQYAAVTAANEAGSGGGMVAMAAPGSGSGSGSGSGTGSGVKKRIARLKPNPAPKPKPKPKSNPATSPQAIVLYVVLGLVVVGLVGGIWYARSSRTVNI